MEVLTGSKGLLGLVVKQHYNDQSSAIGAADDMMWHFVNTGH